MDCAGDFPERRLHRFLEDRGDNVVPLIFYLGGKHKKRDSRARAAHCLSSIYLRKGRVNLASFFIRLAIRLAGGKEYEPLAMKFDIQRAAVMEARGKLNASAKILQMVMDRSVKKGKVDLAADAALKLARIEIVRGNRDDSLSLISFAYWSFKSIPDGDGVNRVLLLKARLMGLRGKTSIALEMAGEVIERLKENSGGDIGVDALLTLMWLYLREGEFDIAAEITARIEDAGGVPDGWRLINIRYLYLRHLLFKHRGLEEEAEEMLKACESLRENCELSREAAMPEYLYGQFATEVDIEVHCCRAGEEKPGYEGRPDSGTEFLTRNPQCQCIMQQVRRIAPYPVPVLLLGESGVGKDVISRMIHHWSGREGKQYIPVNVSALPPGLVENTLFGSVRGAYTDARKDVRGVMATAEGGTVLLDEICELELSLQPKLLRVVEEGEFRVVGESIPRRTDARIIAATNRDIESEVNAGRFRKDLYHRLSVFVFRIPPLRQRRMDIPLLVDHFIDKFCIRFGLGPFNLEGRTMRLLAAYQWPGNVRELKNKTLRAVISRGRGRLSIHAFNLPPRFIADYGEEKGGGYLESKLRSLERSEIIRALGITGGNRSRAARLLGIKRTTMLYRMKRTGIEDYM